MWPFSQTAVETEPAPVETDDDRLAVLDRETREAEAKFNAAVQALRAYNIEHREQPLKFQTGDVLRIVTLINDRERARLERDFRVAFERRNKALSVRAEFLLESGRIR